MGIASFTAARDRLLAAQELSLTGEEACAEIVDAFGTVARIDAAAVMTTDPETHLPAGGVVRGFDASACVPFWDNELLDPDFNKFNDLVKSIDPIATLAESTDGDLARSPRFQKLYAAAGTSDELRVVFMSGSTCLGIAALVRTDGEVYGPVEVRDIRNLIVPAMKVMRSALANSSEPITQRGPVILILDGVGRIVSMSEDADEVLDDLRINIDGEMPGTIMVAAKRARSSRSATKLTTRLRGTSGRWVRIHVSPMAGEMGVVSISIDAAAPTDMVPILLDSYGLSEREVDIVLQLCRGIGTKEIATELSISVHTVRDHLKAIFDKAEVNSRGELVARLFSSHILDQFHTNVVHA